MLAGMTNNATGSGMGTAGFVGQIMTWQTMTASEDPAMVLDENPPPSLHPAGHSYPW